MTKTLNIALAQINPTVGAIADNVAAIRRAYAVAARDGADLVVFPELALMGYPPEDMVLKSAFQQDARTAIDALARITRDAAPAMLVGTAWAEGGKLYNAVVLLDDGEIKAVRFKRELPNYGVFDEKRVFTVSHEASPVSFRGVELGLMVCEDMWFPTVARELKDKGAEIFIVPHGSPYELEKITKRMCHAKDRVAETDVPLVFINQIGGQDELVFDGSSFVLNTDGEIAAHLPDWEEKVQLTQWHKETNGWRCKAGAIAEGTKDMASIYQAMMLGLRDYVRKNRFSGVLVGLSGGVDSALTAAVAVDALGAERVRCVMMPSRYTSQESLEDAAGCASALQVELDTIPIEDAVQAFGTMLSSTFAGWDADTTEENIQSRIRGIILMAMSNKFGHMVVTTGNKSEMSVGYATLYGDMCGGYSVLKDIYKTTVFALCHWRNGNVPKGALGANAKVIPQRIITKPPSAELRSDQKDEDSLPPYEALDDILYCLIEREMGTEEITARGHIPDLVKRIEHLVYVAEYKRRQAPPGVKISARNFGRDRRYPITNGYRDAVDYDFHRWSD